MNFRSFEASSKKLTAFFAEFGKLLRSEEIRSKTRKRLSDFVRIFKFPWYDVLLYLIFRDEKCTSSEISSYYSTIGKPDLRISKQAAFKAIKKVNPGVFPVLIRKFAELFYKTELVKKYKGYILLAEDGTTNSLMATEESLMQFGFVSNQHITSAEDANKATSKSAALYDVTNGLIVNFQMKEYKKSEIPIAVDQLEETFDLFAGQKVIYLADRYYPSVELFAILESHSINYCIRGKPNFFKKEISEMKSDDEWITVTLSKEWIKRLKYDKAKERFLKDPTIRIRVVKQKYTYIDEDGVLQTVELLYFTNLSQEEFSTDDMAPLYACRWDVEVSYKTLKTDYEWERFFSSECDSEVCAIYAKVLFHNIVGVIRKELNLYLKEDDTGRPHDHIYVANITQLAKMIREFGILRFIRSGNRKAISRILNLVYEMRHKIKVPVRPNRHNKRWGRLVTTNSPLRFRIDGRNWPKVAVKNGKLRTVQP